MLSVILQLFVCTQAVQDLVQRIAQMEAHMNTASQEIRDATERATAAESRARAAETAARAGGVRQGEASYEETLGESSRGNGQMVRSPMCIRQLQIEP